MIIEGLKHGDLDGMILSIVSIDEFEPKIDEEAVVIHFHALEHDAAVDLNRFIQRSSVSILDTEVSPAPDQKGRWLVFVELLDDENFEENVTSLLKEVSGLALVSKWTLKIRGNQDRQIETKSANTKRKSVNEVINALKLSEIHRVICEDTIILEDRSGFRFEVIGFGDAETLVGNRPCDLDFAATSKCRRIFEALGSGWQVSSWGNRIIASHPNIPTKSLALRVCS